MAGKLEKVRNKYFDGAKLWQIVLGCALMVTPFLAIIWKM